MRLKSRSTPRKEQRRCKEMRARQPRGAEAARPHNHLRWRAE